MPSQFDPTDFVDSDLESARRGQLSGSTATGGAAESGRSLSREEIDSKVSEAQVKLAELKRAQEDLERERAALEETRRRQSEFTKGREEMVQSITRGLSLLEKAEFDARREAEQMAKSASNLKEALRKLQGIREEQWAKEDHAMELTRALTEVENARREWDAARMSFGVLSDTPGKEKNFPSKPFGGGSLADLSFVQLLKLGFALTWPLVILGAAIFALLLARK